MTGTPRRTRKPLLDYSGIKPLITLPFASDPLNKTQNANTNANFYKKKLQLIHVNLSYCFGELKQNFQVK